MVRQYKRLSAFDITPYDKKLTKTLNVLDEIKDVLQNSAKLVKDRFRQIAEADQDGEGEFISSYKIIGDKMLFACFIKAKEGGAAEIKKAFFDKENFSLSEIEPEEKEDIAGHIKEHAHFLMTKDLIILKSCKNITGEALSTYLNWFLKKKPEHAEKAAVFTLPVHINKKIDINSITAFEIGKQFKIKKQNSFMEHVSRLNTSLIADFLSAANLDLKEADIFDAFLTFKIKKVPKDNEEEKEEAIQTLLSFLKEDGCNILNKQGKVIDTNSIKSTKKIRIAHTDSGFPDEDELEKEMITYLQELRNEKKDNSAT